MSQFLPLTDGQRKEMLAETGASSIDVLIEQILGSPPTNHAFQIPDALSEAEVNAKLGTLALKNHGPHDTISLLGGGCYTHYIPAAVRSIALRPEFYTAYTPYQPEISQGTLQVIFEFQTMICEIAGMEIANASLYDGATALAEGISMAKAISRKNGSVVLTNKNVNPRYRMVAKTYAEARAFKIIEHPVSGEGKWDAEAIDNGEATFAIVVQQPNYLGHWEDLSEITEKAKSLDIPIVVITDLLSCALAEPPGKLGADIVVGDAQMFGNPAGLGGPHLGFIASKRQFTRQMPGRIAGTTMDLDGKPGYVLTAQTREQHIRREKATSNICSNQALSALGCVVHLSLLGRQGFVDLAGRCAANALDIRSGLLGMGFTSPFESPFFREFVIQEDAGRLKRIDECGKLFFGIPLEKYYPEMQSCRLITANELTGWDKVGKAMEDL